MKTTKTISLDKIALTGADAARLIGKSVAWLKQLVEDGFVKKSGSFYSPDEVTQGYIKFLHDEQRRASKGATQTTLQAAKAKEIELRIAREDHNIVALDEALDFVDEVIGVLKSDLLGLGASVSRDASVRTHIDERVNDILQRALARLQTSAHEIRKGDQVVEEIE
jgi:hypothetical protein